MPLLPWILDTGRESEIGWSRNLALYTAATVQLGLGRVEEGLALLAESFASPGAVAAAPDDLPQAVRLALGAGATNLARQLVAEARACAPARPMPLQEHSAATLDALSAEADDDLEAAAAGFADAARLWRDLGVPYEEGHALFGQGRCLVGLGPAPEALAPLSAARELFARLGARPALAEAEVLLRALGGSAAPE